ncbi:MAG: choice-of-anchor tandem repeat GloVer-containing protein, partial [Methylocella sp.]
TTQSGGRTINCNGNCGTVFKLTPPAKGQTAWNEIVLYRFTGGNDGSEPVAGLIADKEGALYSTTAFGGTGTGTVFKLTPPAKGQTAWKETVLYRFTGGSDGIEPRAGLLADKEGALYGTTQSGGGTINCNGNCGTVFKLTPPAKGQTVWEETVLYSFCSLSNCSDGNAPFAGVMLDDQGALYGTTQLGGIDNAGTVFKLTPPSKGQTAWKETVLYSFTGGSDGANPQGNLIADMEGTLYGTTYAGGGKSSGTMFKLTPPAKGQTGWKETVLYSFCALSSCVDGNHPPAGLIADREGALYGTTVGGGINPGSNGGGTVFKLTPPSEGQTAWKETVLYSFTGGSDGAAPQAGLIADKHGALYTTTVAGGSGSFGTVLKLTLCPEPSGRDWREKDDDRDRDRCPAFTPEK